MALNPNQEKIIKSIIAEFENGNIVAPTLSGGLLNVASIINVNLENKKRLAENNGLVRGLHLVMRENHANDVQALARDCAALQMKIETEDTGWRCAIIISPITPGITHYNNIRIDYVVTGSADSTTGIVQTPYHIQMEINAGSSRYRGNSIQVFIKDGSLNTLFTNLYNHIQKGVQKS